MSAPAFVEPLEGVVLPPVSPEEEPADASAVETCGECGEEFTDPPAGARGMKAAALLGKHRWSVHRIKSDGSRAPVKAKAAKARQDQPVDVEPGARGVVTTLHGAASQVGGKADAPPRAADLAKALGYGLSAATKAAASWAVDSDPMIQAAAAEPGGEERRDALVRALSLTQESAGKIAAPIGRVLAPTELNRRYGRTVVEHSDLGPALVELVDVGRTWAQYLAIRRQHLALERQRLEQQAAGPFTPPPAPAPAGPPPPAAPTAPSAAGTGAPLGGGRVATPTYRTQ